MKYTPEMHEELDARLKDARSSTMLTYTVTGEEVDALLGELEKRGREIERLRGARDGLGHWLSAALDDPKVCDEMKIDIRRWMEATA